MLKSPPGPVDTDRLYRDYGAAVARWAGRLAAPSDAEDITQEVFLVVERRRATLPPLRCPAAWLYGITLNLARRRWRERSRQAEVRAQWRDEPADDDRPSPFDELESRRRLQRLEQAMAGLPTVDQHLIWMWDVERLPTARISALTGIKPQTLRVRRFRARSKIARRLGVAQG
jgi:RNA polymerase sigma-70 factor (ECF subfamily)